MLEPLIELSNMQHTARRKIVPHKTRQERAQFLRRFFRAPKGKAGLHTAPDPRKPRQRHVHAMGDALDNPTGFHLTPGQVRNLQGADALLPQMQAEALIADKG